VTRWTQRTPRPVVSEAPDGLDAPVKRAFTIPDTLTPGISGWLLLFVIGQCVGAITGLIRIGQLRSDYRESFGLGLIITGMSPLVVLEIAVQVLAPLIAIVGTVLTVRRSRYAPRFWFGYFVFSIGYLAVDLGMMLYVQSELGRLLGAAYRAESGGYSTFGRGLFRALIASAVWAAYWARSHRVRVTFGAAALDHIAYPVRHVADAAIIPADPIGPHRRKRKLALRVAGGIIGAVILLGGIGLLETYARRYSVPAGSDIRKTVAGRWTWVSDKKGCANAHIIAFSDDGKIMTIVQPSHDIAGQEITTTYDVKALDQSMVRGAIRGERRLDDKGKPVVWDLVLTGPDEYRWRRTDWSSPWGYTGRVVRCPPGADSVPGGTRR